MLQACIELHQTATRAPHFDKPDYLVYDFDPPAKLVELPFVDSHLTVLTLQLKKDQRGGKVVLDIYRNQLTTLAPELTSRHLA